MATPAAFLALLPLALFAAGSALTAPNYHLKKIIPIGGDGGWDYVTIDPVHGKIYLPRGKHTQVVSEASGQVIADISGQNRNHGVALVPSVGRGFISDSEDACLYIFDLATNRVLGKVMAADDADGIIYDEQSNKVFVVCGDASVVIPIAPDVDPEHGSADPAIELGGKPEFLGADGRGHLFVNLVDKNLVAVVDTKAMKVTGKWATTPGGSPVGMAIDPEGHRLFVGCRKPQQLVVLNSDDGHVEGSVPIGAGVDATAFDQGLAFASCRDGTLTVAQLGAGGWAPLATVATKPGARTLGADRQTHALFLPTAEFLPGKDGGRPAAKTGSFMLVEVTP